MITIMKNGEWSTLEAAVRKYGGKHQVLKAVEEMAELTQALMKNLDGAMNVGNVVEEMADVEIMLQQLRLIYANDLAVETQINLKLARLKARMEAQGHDD